LEGKPVVVRAFDRLEVLHPRAATPGPVSAPLRARQLLAYLLAAYPEGVASEVLIERLWPENPQGTGANSLYVAVHALRRTLEPAMARGGSSHYIQRVGDSYHLALDSDLSIDVLDFEEIYKTGMTTFHGGGHEAAARTFERALELYRGPFLGDPHLDLAAEFEAHRYRLRRQWQEMGLVILESLLRNGQWEQADLLRVRLLEIDPWDEMAVASLRRLFQEYPPKVRVPLGRPSHLPARRASRARPRPDSEGQVGAAKRPDPDR
jgi:DNA-binding SARP family transcriptional activator